MKWLPFEVTGLEDGTQASWPTRKGVEMGSEVRVVFEGENRPSDPKKPERTRGEGLREMLSCVASVEIPRRDV